jgi:hypothetical protein
VNGALFFYGPYVDVPNHAELDFGTGDFSIDAWVRAVQCGPAFLSPIVDKFDPSTDIGFSFYLEQNPAGTAFLKLRINAATFTSANPFPAGANPLQNTGQWVHVAVAVNRTTGGTFYINGAPAGTFTPPAGSVTNTVAMLIGEIRPAGPRCEIAIDELELFKRELTQSDIQAIFTAGPAGKCKPCTAAVGSLDISTGQTAIGSVDPIWKVISAPAGVPTPLTAYVILAASPGWVAAPPGSNWIDPNNTGGFPPMVSDPAGLYVYETHFTVPAGIASLTLNFQFAADNDIKMFLNGNLIPNTTVVNAFNPINGPITVTQANPAPGIYTLRAEVVNQPPIIGPTGLLVKGTVRCEPAPGKATADLGDAPDSTNHHGKAMEAYPTVPANFPTVFNPGTGLPQGPKHLHPQGLAWLGPDVSFEDEADIGPDQDPTNNLDFSGTTPVPDKDLKDDGVVLPIAIPMICGQTQFRYTVTSTQAARLYVNVWFDFNRDGDWNDPIQKCPLGPAVTGSFTEWAVQNEPITVVPGLNNFTTPVFGAANPTKGSEMWMRITLTDQPIAPANGADGSGPSSGYQYGETEDYLLRLSYTELCGIKFNDLNGNGQQDPGEPGLANWVIEVKDANGNIIGYAVTDANGRYCIVVPTPATYIVSEQQQVGWTQTAPPTPGTYTVTVPPAHTNLNFGNRKREEGKAEICVFKFEDLNGNGVRDGNEPLLGGWQFTVSPPPLLPTTSPVTTLPSGGICFGVSAPGTYTITEIVQSGWTPTTPNPQIVTVSPNQLVNVFFGNKKKEEPKFEICGIKFEDKNGNGKQDSGEPGLKDWTINLVFGTPPNQIDLQAITDANGRYCFKGLAPGTYTVSETLQSGWIQTFPPTPGKYTVTLPPSRTDINFGNKKTEEKPCDLVIRKSVSPNPVQSGQPITVTLTVINVGGPCGPNTVVQDPATTGLSVPSQVVAVSQLPSVATWGCAIYAGGVVQCITASTLPPGYSATFTFTATVTVPGSIPNCATVTNPNDTNLTNNQSCVTITATVPIIGPLCRDVTINLSTGVAPWAVSPGTVGVITNLGPLAGTWVAPTVPVRWIQPTNQATPQMLPGGFYQYNVPFTLPGPLTQYSTITLTGRYAADNTVHQFFVGPAQTAPGGPLCTPTNANCFSAWTPFSITAPTAFTTGLNTLNVRVYNNPTGRGGPTYTGLVVEATLRAVCRR